MTRLLFPVLFAVLLLSGCGSREGHVSGKVTLDGKPLGRAQLRFHHEDDKNELPVAAATGEEGLYRVIGFQGDTIPPGKYRITVVRMVLRDGTMPEGEKILEAEARGWLRNHLPKTYEDVATTPFQAEIRPGDNTVNLELKTQ
jgi:hypothetical protein